MKMLVPMLALTLAAGATAPAGDTQSERAAKPAELSRPVTVVIDSFITEDLEDINADLEKAADANEDWVTDPVRVAMNIVEQGPDVVEERHYLQITWVGEGERPHAGVVTVVTDGYLDDSMRGEWCRFAMAKQDDGSWRVTEFRHAWRCWRGRMTVSGEPRRDGLDHFSSDRCL